MGTALFLCVSSIKGLPAEPLSVPFYFSLSPGEGILLIISIFLPLLWFLQFVLWMQEKGRKRRKKWLVLLVLRLPSSRATSDSLHLSCKQHWFSKEASSILISTSWFQDISLSPHSEPKDGNILAVSSPVLLCDSSRSLWTTTLLLHLLWIT